MTEFYKRPETRGLSTPMQHALAFKHLMENKTICINDGELIVGERGPAPKATPDLPRGLHATPSRTSRSSTTARRPPSRSDEETRRVYAEEIIPFWQGRSQRDRIFAEMTQEWLDAYEAGVFTEFMEQRAPGHTVLDDKIYRKGMLDFKKDIEAALAGLDFLNDPAAYDKQEELKAMAVSVRRRSSPSPGGTRRRPGSWRKAEKDAARKKELERIAEVCDRVPAHAPRDFWEALQYYWFVHLGVITEINTWDSFNPGRLDQHLWPFYQKGLADGTLTKEHARELLAGLLGQVQQPARPAQGRRHGRGERHLHRLRPDQRRRPEGGRHRRRQRADVPHPRRDRGDAHPPAELDGPDQRQGARTRSCCGPLKIIKTGFGQPSIFNTDAIVQELIRQGKSVVDARNGGVQRLRRGRGLRQRSLHPDRLLQPAQGLRDHAEQRRRPADGEEDRSRDGRPDGVRDLRRALRGLPEADPPLRRHQDPRQQRHREAVRRRTCPRRSCRSSSTTASRTARTTTTAAPATTRTTSRASAWARSPTS